MSEGELTLSSCLLSQFDRIDFCLQQWLQCSWLPRKQWPRGEVAEEVLRRHHPLRPCPVSNASTTLRCLIFPHRRLRHTLMEQCGRGSKRARRGASTKSTHKSSRPGRRRRKC